MILSLFCFTKFTWVNEVSGASSGAPADAVLRSGSNAGLRRLQKSNSELRQENVRLKKMLKSLAATQVGTII